MPEEELKKDLEGVIHELLKSAALLMDWSTNGKGAENTISYTVQAEDRLSTMQDVWEEASRVTETIFRIEDYIQLKA